MEKKRKDRKTLRRRLILIVLGIVLGVNVYLANANSLTGNKLPMPFGIGSSVVMSGSMEPTLHVDDMIFVRETDQYQVGDIVVYQSGHSLVVHRIISMDGENILTQGDANNIPDNPIVKDDIKGVAIFHIPMVGILVKALKSPLGILAVLACAFLLIELSFRKEKEEKDKNLETIKEEIRKLKAEQEENK